MSTEYNSSDAHLADYSPSSVNSSANSNRVSTQRLVPTQGLVLSEYDNARVVDRRTAQALNSLSSPLTKSEVQFDRSRRNERAENHDDTPPTKSFQSRYKNEEYPSSSSSSSSEVVARTRNPTFMEDHIDGRTSERVSNVRDSPTSSSYVHVEPDYRSERTRTPPPVPTTIVLVEAQPRISCLRCGYNHETGRCRKHLLCHSYDVNTCQDGLDCIYTHQKVQFSPLISDEEWKKYRITPTPKIKAVRVEQPKKEEKKKKEPETQDRSRAKDKSDQRPQSSRGGHQNRSQSRNYNSRFDDRRRNYDNSRDYNDDRDQYNTYRRPMKSEASEILMKLKRLLETAE